MATEISSVPFWTGAPNAADFTRIHDDNLARAQAAIDRLTAVEGPRTIENTLVPYDEARFLVEASSAQASLVENVHPDADLRAAAERTTQTVAAFATALSLNRDIYDALSRIDLTGTDPATEHYVRKTLREFRLAGVDKDELTRAKIEDLNHQLVEISQEFSRTIREDVRTVTVTDAGALAGLPDDYIARHAPDETGTIAITTDYPDSQPVFAYAHNDDLRRRLFLAYNNRAYPKNLAVLDQLIAARDELARLIGYRHWADYVTANKMVERAVKAGQFIDTVANAAAERATYEYGILLDRKRREYPDAEEIFAWETTYWATQVRKSDYAFDAQAVRPYFPYHRVKQGVLDTIARVFAVEFRRDHTAPVWHESVECWEMLEGGAVVGRFYLDMHPRPNKYNHAAQFDIRPGVNGKAIPEAALVCNFPGNVEGDPGLMEHGDVVTLFHEFGHLLHTLFGGRQRWAGVSGIKTEWDFVEVPSQLLEEWAWDVETLQGFARHYETNEPIPADLVHRMKRANEFGKALGVRRQMYYAKLSLSCYDRPADEVDTEALTRSLAEKYLPYRPVADTHLQCAFGHLDGYSATYYTYMWSLVIAKDIFGTFGKERLLADGIAARYRDMILAPGGSRPAGKLVEHYLGRSFNFDAWRDWLEAE